MSKVDSFNQQVSQITIVGTGLLGASLGLGLEAAGFKVTLDDYVRHLPAEQIRKYGLLPNEDIYLCEKV